jgi:hypothetical protein
MTERTDPTPPAGPAATNPPPASTAPAAGATGEAPPPRKRGGIGRIIKWALLVLLLLVVGIGIYVYVNLNRIVETTVERQGTAQLNVPTTLGGANVSLFGGSVQLSDFNLGSPEGYAADQMMSLGGLDVQVKLSELRNDPIRIASINVSNPKLVLEQKGLAFNIKKFIDGLPAGDPAPADEEPLKLIIGNLKVTGTQVVLRPDVQAIRSALPGGVGEQLRLQDEYVLTIPPIELTDIGTGEGAENGAAIKDVVTMLVTEMSSKAAQSEQLPPEIRQILSGDVSAIADAVRAKVTQEVQKQVDSVKAQVEEKKAEVQQKIESELGKAAGDVLKDPQQLKEDPQKAIEQGLGGLLNRRKEQPKQPATQPK